MKDIITISITNPWSKALVERDISDLTQAQLDGYAQAMGDDSREEINARGDLLDASPAQWLAAWVELVGPEEAGRVIIGS